MINCKDAIQLSGLSRKDAVTLIRKRIGNLKIIDNEMIAKIYEKSSNPRKLLKNVEDVLRHAVEHDRSVDEESIMTALSQ